MALSGVIDRPIDQLINRFTLTPKLRSPWVGTYARTNNEGFTFEGPVDFSKIQIHREMVPGATRECQNFLCNYETRLRQPQCYIMLSQASASFPS
jgi:hypothetical protein